MKEYNLVIIGAGSAGMAAAIAASKAGIQDILILERGEEPGGILLQCIHNGFGLHCFGEELCGPAYAERWANLMAECNIQCSYESMVLHLGEDKTILYSNAKEGYVKVKGKSIILAMGCRERTRGAIGIPGYRPAGIWTAGTAQRYLNLDGYMVGRKVFILGSGDIGLIMARRMTLEGAKVLGVAELMPYSNGLPRNIKQCLEDYSIPLYLSHTVTNLKGKKRLEQVEIAQVDTKGQPIPGTEKTFEADTLLLSVGLIPENGLSEEGKIVLDPATKGPLVNDRLETSVPGIFACGNVLHVHDLVDFVSEEGTEAGNFAAAYLSGEITPPPKVQITAGEGIGYVLPKRITSSHEETPLTLKFRVKRPKKMCLLRLKTSLGTVLKEQKKPYLIPSEMEKMTLPKLSLEALSQGDLILEVEEVNSHES